MGDVSELAERMREALEGGDIDGGTFFDMMVRLGLFVEVPADEEYREEWDMDTMYVLSWSPEGLDAQKPPT